LKACHADGHRVVRRSSISTSMGFERGPLQSRNEMMWQRHAEWQRHGS